MLNRHIWLVATLLGSIDYGTFPLHCRSLLDRTDNLVCLFMFLKPIQLSLPLCLEFSLLPSFTEVRQHSPTCLCFQSCPSPICSHSAARIHLKKLLICSSQILARITHHLFAMSIPLCLLLQLTLILPVPS